MGLRSGQGGHNDEGICAVGRWDSFSQNFGWEVEKGSPLQDPLYC